MKLGRTLPFTAILFASAFAITACTHKDQDGSDPYQADTGIYERKLSDSKIERVLVYQSYSNMYFETYRFFSNTDSDVEHAAPSGDQTNVVCPVSIQGHAKSFDGRYFTFYVIAVSQVGHDRLSDECGQYVDKASLRYQQLWKDGTPLEMTVDRSLFQKL